MKQQSQVNHFKYIYHIENEYFVTFFKHPELFNKYYVKQSIFVQDHIGQLLKIIETLYHDKISTSLSNLYVEIQKIKVNIEYEQLNLLIQSTKPLNLDTIESTIKTIRLNTARIKLYEISNKAIDVSINVSSDINDMILSVSQQIETLQDDLSISGDDFDEIMASIIGDTQAISNGKQRIVFKTGFKEIDKKLPFVENTIILIGGGAKHGKSRFVLWLMKTLMDNNPDTFAVKWYSFEEDSKELARNFIANDTILRDSQITGKEEPLTESQLDNVIASANKFKKLNIKIEPLPKNINQVKSEFQIFVKKNNSKVPVLIIDNLLLLTDKKDFSRDDHIMNTINHIKQRTKAIIILIHHFNDEQQDKERANMAFRPILKHLKGQESYRRVPKVILLVNYPYKVPEIANKYTNEKDILKHMFICDVAAIRDMPEIEMNNKSSNEPNLIHFYASLDYNIFAPLSSLY